MYLLFIIYTYTLRCETAHRMKGCFGAFLGLFWGWVSPYISCIHTAYIGEDSSILGTLFFWWIVVAMGPPMNMCDAPPNYRDSYLAKQFPPSSHLQTFPKLLQRLQYTPTNIPPSLSPIPQQKWVAPLMIGMTQWRKQRVCVCLRTLFALPQKEKDMYPLNKVSQPPVWINKPPVNKVSQGFVPKF